MAKVVVSIAPEMSIGSICRLPKLDLTNLVEIAQCTTRWANERTNGYKF